MKMKNKWLFLLLFIVVAAPIIAQVSGRYYVNESRNMNFTGDVALSGSENWQRHEVTVTSSTLVTLPENARFVSVTSNINNTAMKVAGGQLYQVITLTAGLSGSNTLRFDDGTSMALTGNITLTEGASPDYLHLICIDADGDEWAGLGSSVN